MALVDEGNLARAQVSDIFGDLGWPQASSVGEGGQDFALRVFLDFALVSAQRAEVFAPAKPLHGVSEDIQQR